MFNIPNLPYAPSSFYVIVSVFILNAALTINAIRSKAFSYKANKWVLRIVLHVITGCSKFARAA